MITYVCKRIYLAYTYIKPLSQPKYLIQKYFRRGYKMPNFVNILTLLNVTNFPCHQTCEENGDLSKLTRFECKSTIR